MKCFEVNLNIHYTAPEWVWNTLKHLYAEMPYWNDETGKFDKDGKVIEISIEPSGLQFYAEMSEKEWNEWIEEFKKRAAKLLGYEIGEPENGYEFKFWDLPLSTKYSEEELEIIKRHKNRKYPFEILSTIKAKQLDLKKFEKHQTRIFTVNKGYIAETVEEREKVWAILEWHKGKLVPWLYDDDLEHLFESW